MKKKNILVAIISLFLLNLTSCQNQIELDNSVGNYVEDSEKFEGFTNPSKKIPEYSENIVLDGVFSEDEYSNLIWWEEKYVTPADTVTVKMTSYFGKKGVFMGFDVDDEKVFVNDLRTSYNNSGLEVYFGRPGATSLQGNAFEIDMIPNNSIHPKFYFNGYYWAYPASPDKAPAIGTTLKGGKLNTSDCKGYNMEVYLPYEYLLGKDEKPDYINVNVALLRATSADKKNSDRLWYDFGEHFNSSYNWGNPESYWKFNQSGLMAKRVNLSSNNIGTISSEKNYVTNYGDIKVEINPYEGSYLKKITCNDEDVTSQIRYDENDNPYYLAKKVSEDIEIKAEFDALPSGVSGLTGNLTYNDEKLSEELISDLKVKYQANGLTYYGSLYNNGKYLFRNIPELDGKVIIESLSGYEVVSKAIKTSTSNEDFNINFTNDDYGPQRSIKLETVESINGAKKTIYKNDILKNSIGSNFIYSFNLKYDGRLFDQNGIVLQDPSYGAHPSKYSAFNLNGNMVNKSGTSTGSFNMQIMHWNANGYWMIKLWVDNKAVETKLGIDFLRDLNADGVDLIVTNENRKIIVYQSLNGKLFKLIEHSSSVEEKEWYINDLTCYGENPDINSSWSVCDSKLKYNLDDDKVVPYGKIRSLDSHMNFSLEEGKVHRTCVSWDPVDFVNGGFTSRIKIPGILGENGEIIYEPFTAGFRFNLSKTDTDWFPLNVYIYCDGENYYVSGDNTVNSPNQKVKLDEQQINKIATEGLLIGLYKNNRNVSYFVESQNGTKEISTTESLGYLNWYNHHNLGSIDLIHNAEESLGIVYTENTKIYAIDTELSKEDFYKMIGE